MTTAKEGIKYHDENHRLNNNKFIIIKSMVRTFNLLDETISFGVRIMAWDHYYTSKSLR